MLQIFTNNEKKSTTAIINDCGTDALERIGRTILGRHPECIVIDDTIDKKSMNIQVALQSLPNGASAVMTNKVVGTVRCDDRDTYSAEVGEAEAVKKAMSNHNRAFKKALTRWQIAMLKDIIAVSPDTFEEALYTVRPCKCKCD